MKEGKGKEGKEMKEGKEKKGKKKGEIEKEKNEVVCTWWVQC